MSNDRERLAKLLNMLGSTFDGERANAARLIARMAERKNLSIAEMVLPPEDDDEVTTFVWRPSPAPPRPAPAPAPRKARAPRKPREKQEKRDEAATVLRALREIAEAEDLEFVLTAWELQFAIEVPAKSTFDFELSGKQLAAAQAIIDKVEKARGRANPA